MISCCVIDVQWWLLSRFNHGLSSDWCEQCQQIVSPVIIAFHRLMSFCQDLIDTLVCVCCYGDWCRRLSVGWIMSLPLLEMLLKSVINSQWHYYFREIFWGLLPKDSSWCSCAITIAKVHNEQVAEFLFLFSIAQGLRFHLGWQICQYYEPFLITWLMFIHWIMFGLLPVCADLQVGQCCQI